MTPLSTKKTWVDIGDDSGSKFLLGGVCSDPKRCFEILCCELVPLSLPKLWLFKA